MRGVLLGFLLVLLAVGVAGVAHAGRRSSVATGAWDTQAEALASCNHDASPGVCSLRAWPGGPEQNHADIACPSGWVYGGYGYVQGGGVGWVQDGIWCVPAQCLAGQFPDGTDDHVYSGMDMATGTHCRDGCAVTMHLSYAGKNAGDSDADGYSVGYWETTGARCVASYGVAGETPDDLLPAPPKLTPVQGCDNGKLSCYNPWNDSFCATSQSGETICVPRQQPPQGGCISGATGSVCVGANGSPPPPPPDPPIMKDTPPDGSDNYTINNGGTINNYTTNNYSGTSPGPGPSSSSPPSSSPGGSGSNTSGNGNTGENGTDANGNCPNGSKPTASGCSGTYTDNGCDTPPACFGDAVLCGIAANTHKTACNAASGSSVGSPPSGLDGDPTDNSGDPTSSAVSSSVDLGDATGSLDSSGFGYSSSCPLQDVSFSVFGQSVDIPFADKCDKLAFLKYIVLALAYFMAAKIIAGVQ